MQEIEKDETKVMRRALTIMISMSLLKKMSKGIIC